MLVDFIDSTVGGDSATSEVDCVCDDGGRFSYLVWVAYDKLPDEGVGDQRAISLLSAIEWLFIFRLTQDLATLR